MQKDGWAKYIKKFAFRLCWYNRRTLGNKNENAVWVSLWENSLFVQNWQEFWIWKRLSKTLWSKSSNGIFVTLQLTVFGRKKFQILCTRSKKLPIWHFWSRAWNLKIFVAKYLNLKCHHWTFSKMCLSLPNPEFVLILDKKVIFSKGHLYSISILVS